MDDSIRPPLGAEVYEDIAVEQHEVHERYWPLLKLLAGPSTLVLAVRAGIPGPIPPKQPLRLFKALGEYACALFDVEAKRYPSDPQFQSWITQLLQRTEATVIDNLEQMERPTLLTAPGEFTYHATKAQMQNAVRSALADHAKRYPKTVTTSATAQPHGLDETMLFQQQQREARVEAEAKQQARKQLIYEQEVGRLRNATKSESPKTQSAPIDPKALRDWYLSSFVEKIVILDICWAAKQHYREWTRWIGGELKIGSKPDMAFRAILNSRKKPEAYRPELRPKGWK